MSEYPTQSAFSVFVRVKPLLQNNKGGNNNTIFRVINNEISIHDPGPLGDYIVF